MSPGGYVVVLFGDGTHDWWCKLADKMNLCPLGTARWFNTRDEANTYAKSVPPGFDPHTLLVEDDPGELVRKTRRAGEPRDD